MIKELLTFFDLGELTVKEIHLLAGSILLTKTINYSAISEGRGLLLKKAREKIERFDRIQVREICFQVMLDE